MQFNDFHDSEGDTAFSLTTHPDAPPEGERWSTWDAAQHGPVPRPEWVITDLGAVDADLGVLKTGKEADVHLVHRWVPGTERELTMAAKRFRTGDHRLFHRDAGYLEGRRVRRSREMRAMARRTEFGKELVSRLVQTRPDAELLAELFEQLRSSLRTLASEGWTHGDLSPYNVLLDGERLVLIDWPQIVDIIGNPQGFAFLERDVTTMCAWFTAKGLPVDAGELLGDLIAEATALG